ncbi:MAG: hypothetical protein GY708_24500 [Actinomycetia bacterium]|nr:hypothetical protein [Actinomycetes bacterium]MCP4958508.1 hypothetical protein [Actinomycetes bacterium]
MSGQEIQVMSLDSSRANTNADRRYAVRWRVDGRDQVRSFDNQATAQRLRAQLRVKAASGTEFDSTTGLPPSVGAATGNSGVGQLLDVVA